MLLETCVVDTSLHILQEFHVKQRHMYWSNYYPLFAKILYLLWKVGGGKATLDYFVVIYLFIILQDFLIQ